MHRKGLTIKSTPILTHNFSFYFIELLHRIFLSKNFETFTILSVHLER